MKLITKIILILTLSITYSYSACNFKAELGIKKEKDPMVVALESVVVLPK